MQTESSLAYLLAYLLTDLPTRLLTRYQLINYNVERKNMSSALKITPGKKSPSILPLEKSDWVAVQAMVLKKEVAEIIDRLTDCGAEDILVFALSNCRV